MDEKIIRVKSISQGHQLRNLPSPAHPFISIIDNTHMKGSADLSVVLDFYFISLKRGCDMLGYGQQKYDFNEGVMSFIAPNQVLKGNNNAQSPNFSGWALFFHPDLLWNTPLAKKMKQYEFFDYKVNEALFLSEKEESIINGIVNNIKHEYNSSIDKFSQDIIISHLETLLNYAERFYERQFITRKISNHKVLERLEDILNDYFKNEELHATGLPTVQFIADKLNISSKYLGNLLKQLTGQTTQQHIHAKLIEKAKERLSTTSLSVSEIAYELGFEHSQSFSKLFKAKTKTSPLEFRASFN